VTGTTVSVDATVAAVFREEAGRLTGSLTRALGNFDVAEESVQDALLTALERWPREGIPQRPGAWLATVARNRAVVDFPPLAGHRGYAAGVDGSGWS